MHAQKNRRADQWLFCFAVALSTVFAPALARGTPSPNDGIWTELVPTAVSSTCAIVDPVRHRLVFFGGDSEGATSRSVWALSLEGTPVWTVLTPVGPGPEARYGHSAIYDPVRDRMIIFGGYSHGTETYHDDVWALSLSGPSTWTQIQPSGALPAGRFDHSAIYDPVQDRMVVFGGHNLPHYARSDLWSLNLAGAPAWSELTVAGASPGGRSSHTAVYDPLHRQMILCGGNTSPSVNSSQSWTLSLGDSMAWSLVAVAAAPPGRARHAAAFDPVRNRMLVFGGHDGVEARGDVLALSFSGFEPSWYTLPAGGTPPGPRNAPSAAYEPEADRLLVFGGYDSVRRNEAWELPLDETHCIWNELVPSAAPPPPRERFTATYDNAGDRMIVLAGSRNFSEVFDDVWALSLSGHTAWAELHPTGEPMPGRCGHSAILDPIRHRLVVFGGNASPLYGPVNDVWTLSLSATPEWAPLVPSGMPPRSRAFHSAVYDPVRDRMLAFGGENDAWLGQQDVWALSMGDAPVWTELFPSGSAPPPRCGQSAIYDPARDRIVIYGGHAGTSAFPGFVYSDVWALSLSGSPQWSELTPAGTGPGPRAYHAAIYDPVRDRMLVYGQGGPDDLWALSFAGNMSWSLLSPLPPQEPRLYSSAIFDPLRDRMVVFGGDHPYPGNDTWALSMTNTLGAPEDDAPARTALLDAPVPNPAGSSCELRFSVPIGGRVQLGVFDLTGRLVRVLEDADRKAGPAVVHWNGDGDRGGRLAAGVYFLRLAAPGVRESRKLVLMR